MNTELTAGPRWSTSAFATDEHMLTKELSALGEHLEMCKGLTGRLFTLHCLADAVHCFVAPRFVTTLLVATALIGGSLALS